MFYSLTGKLIHMEPHLAVISCGGVGFKCLTTLTTLSCMPPLGGEATLYTHLNVREDAMDLFGFWSLNELHSFRMLIGVSGVGPKSALAILSDLTPDRLAVCIASGDAKSLRSAPGIGPKVAQRILLELKDKITDADLSEGMGEVAAQMKSETSSMSEAVSALCVLGYSQSEAARSLAGLDPALAVDELIRRGLKAMSTGK